jgi:hypothetical protein
VAHCAREWGGQRLGHQVAGDHAVDLYIGPGDHQIAFDRAVDNHFSARHIKIIVDHFAARQDIDIAAGNLGRIGCAGHTAQQEQGNDPRHARRKAPCPLCRARKQPLRPPI